MCLESLNCYRGSTSLRKEERPFLSGDGEESFSTTFSHPAGQILIRVLFSAAGASSSSAPGTMQGCSFLPWDTGCWLWWSPCRCLCCSEQRCSPNRSCWIPFPLLQWHHWLWHASLTMRGGLTQNGRGRTAVGWNGLAGGAQKTSTKQVPASSTLFSLMVERLTTS